MLSYAVAACLVLAASAQMGNMNQNMMNMMGQMGGQNWMNQMAGGQMNGQGNMASMLQNMMGMMGQRQGMGNMGNMGMGNMGNMGMGNMGNQGMGNMGMGNMGNMGNMRDMGGNRGGSMGMGNMGMGGGRQQQQGVGGLVTLMILDKLMNDGSDKKSEPNAEEAKFMEEVMKRQFMMEMAEMMMVYLDFQDKQEKFAGGMTRLCTMVEAGYEAAKRNGTDPFVATTEATMMELEASLMTMSQEEQLEAAIKGMQDEQAWQEIFWRYATYSCMMGEEYMKAAQKMEALSKGEMGGECKQSWDEDSSSSDSDSESWDRK